MTTASSANSLRLALFGLPNAGKTSLLAALEQAVSGADTPSRAELRELAQQLAQAVQKKGAEAAHQVHYQPGGAGHVPVTILDCDGRLTDQALRAEQLYNADTLILAVDAAAPPAQLDA